LRACRPAAGSDSELGASDESGEDVFHVVAAEEVQAVVGAEDLACGRRRRRQHKVNLRGIEAEK
jgi:hypothetical protein